MPLSRTCISHMLQVICLLGFDRQSPPLEVFILSRHLNWLLAMLIFGKKLFSIEEISSFRLGIVFLDPLIFLSLSWLNFSLLSIVTVDRSCYYLLMWTFGTLLRSLEWFLFLLWVGFAIASNLISPLEVRERWLGFLLVRLLLITLN